eukprot:jgi/Ulvmu1/1922/UM012_0082.1
MHMALWINAARVCEQDGRPSAAAAPIKHTCVLQPPPKQVQYPGPLLSLSTRHHGMVLWWHALNCAHCAAACIQAHMCIQVSRACWQGIPLLRDTAAAPGAELAQVDGT